MEIIEQINNLKEFIEKTYLSELRDNLSKNKNFIEIDFFELAKFNPSLADLLLDNPDEIITNMEEVLKDFDLEFDRTPQVLFYNLPKSTEIPLNEVSDQLGRFLSFEGHVVKPSDIYLKCRSAKFECPSCGDVVTVQMNGRDWKEPKGCACGRKGKSKLLSQELIKFQRLEINESVDKVPDRPMKLIKKKVFIPENLTRKDINHQLQPGQKVRIYGTLELEELKSMKSHRTNEYRTNIIANNIIPIDTSWGAIKLTKKQIKKVKEMSKNKDLLNEFSKSLAPSFEGYDWVRKSLILQHVGGKRIYDENGNLEERGIIHVLMSSSPGGGKTYLLKKSIVLSPLWQWTQGAGLTKAGLVACISKDEYGSYALEVGPLVMSDKGICAIDEFDKVNKIDFGILNNAMNDEQTKITKANIDQTLKVRTSVLASSNPIHKRFTDSEPILKQLAPIPKDILDRFDVIWAMREKIDQNKLEDKYISRHFGSNNIKQIWSNEEMTNYISYAKKTNPMMTPKMAKYFKKKKKKLTKKTIDENENEKSHRLRGNILRWAYAHCKFTSIGRTNKNKEVDLEKESIDFAFSLVTHSFNLLGLLDEKGFVKYEEVEGLPSKKEVSKYYLVKQIIRTLCDEGYKDGVPYDVLLNKMKKETDIDEDMLDKEIEKLKKVGELYEPKRNQLALL